MYDAALVPYNAMTVLSGSPCYASQAQYAIFYVLSEKGRTLRTCGAMGRNIQAKTLSNRVSRIDEQCKATEGHHYVFFCAHCPAATSLTKFTVVRTCAQTRKGYPAHKQH